MADSTRAERTRPTRAGQSRAPRHATRRRAGRALWLVAGIAVLLAVLGLIVSAHTGNNRASPAAAVPVGAAIGDRAPDFTLRDLQGRPVSLHSFLGTPVLLHFWAVDCTTCQAEQPDYLRAIKDLGPHAPTILAADAWGETAEYVAPYVKKFHLPSIVLIDPGHSVFNGTYGMQGTPTAVYIDRQGLIKGMAIGQESYAQIVANARLIIS